MAQLKAILFDLDGVLYQENRVIEGARETLAWVREKQIPHLFLTNTTSRPRAAIVAKLAQMGMVVAEEALLTPPVAAARWLKASGMQRLALFMAPATESEFAEFVMVHGEPADAVVVGDLGDGWDFATLNRAFDLLMNDHTPPLVALGMTRYWQAEGRLRLDVGPFIKALEYAVGREAVVMGKPAPHYYEVALSLLGVTAHESVMIGDDIRGDIEGAQQVGMHALLVRTGKFRPSDLSLGIHPDGVINSIADLPRWWRDYSATTSSPK